MQIHAFFLALFSSLIAPFGGFFASGFKRAFKVKVSKCHLCKGVNGLRYFACPIDHNMRLPRKNSSSSVYGSLGFLQ